MTTEKTKAALDAQSCANLEDVYRARKYLAEVCSGIIPSMSIPAQESDFDLTFKRIIDQCEQALTALDRIEAVDVMRAGDALLQFEKHVTELPLGAENKSYGASAYNWGTHYTNILRRIVKGKE